ncbi:MAG: type II secretion system protein GspG [Planctomycetaceae bacterium]|jgi:prepilin-type N-terminal cleavage/methylation domain-containing protein|nr:type II secretion system protein GspG [Planctomycetaceae bacterium]
MKQSASPYRPLPHTVRTGFTLIEILIVMAIIAALFALLLPGLFNRQKQSQIKEADIKIKQLGGFLEQYNIENRGYPTTEQGLYSLIYIPDNTGVSATSPTGIPGMGTLTDPTGGMGGNAVAVGSEMLNGQQPAAMGSDPNVMMGGSPMGNNPMGSSTGAGMWNMPVSNPSLYTQLRKRSAPYVDSEKDLLDPWGTPYRYDNSLAFNGVNQTGTQRPALWSAGPDKADNTDDDIRNWDPAEAQQLMAQRQAQGAGQSGGMIDPMTGQATQPGQMMNPAGMPGGDAAGMLPGQPAGAVGPGGLPAMPAGGMPAVPAGMPATTPAMPPTVGQ